MNSQADLPGEPGPEGPSNPDLEACLEQIFEGKVEDLSTFLAQTPAEFHGDLRRVFLEYAHLRGQIGEGSRQGAGQEIGDYRLVQELGRGGMGEVWEATQQALNRRVAVKILFPNHALIARRQARFKQEAAAGARLNHPNIITVFSFEEVDGRMLLVQELVPGGRTYRHELDGQRREDRPRDTAYYRRQVEILVQVAEALAYAHEAGVVHRDIKPSNILLNVDGIPKIGDFGLARLQGEEGLSMTGELAGTPHYMAPEQVGAPGEVGPACDVFALGITLYEALTLTRPFEGDTPPEVLDRIRRDEPLDPRRLRAKIPKDLAVICLKALEKRPEHRYESMAAFAEDLGRFLRGEPILAKAPGPWQLAVKWCRRHPVIASAGGVAAAAFVVVSLLLVENHRARIEAKRSETAALSHAAAAEKAEKAALAAQEEAEAGRLQARREAATTLRVLEFLIDIFGEADPRKARGKPMTAVQLVERGVARVETMLQEEPDVLARMQGVLGRVQVAQGFFEEGADLLRKAMDLQRQLEGADSEKAWNFQVLLGGAYRNLGKYQQAEELLVPALDALLRIQGEDSNSYQTGRRALGNLRAMQGRREEATEIYQQALEKAERDGKGQGTFAISLRKDLAILYLESGRVDLAEPLLEQVAADFREQLGALDPATLSTEYTLCVLYYQKQLYRQALEVGETLLPKCQQVYGERDLTLMVRNMLAGQYWALGQIEDAVDLFEESLEVCEQANGKDNLEYWHAMVNLANVYRNLGRVDEAVEMLEECLQRAEKNVGPDNSFCFSVRQALVDTYSSMDRMEEAVQLADRQLTRAEARFGKTDPLTVDAAIDVGELAIKEGRFEEAIAVSAEYLEAREALNLDQDALRMRLMIVHGAGLYRNFQFEEAVKIRREVYQWRKSLHQDPWDPPLRRSQVELAEALAGIGALQEAQSLLLPMVSEEHGRDAIVIQAQAVLAWVETQLAEQQKAAGE